MAVGYSDDEIESALTIFNKLPDYVCWKNTDLQYVMLNNVTARMFGFSSSKISYDRISDFELQCDAVELAENFREDDATVLETGNDITILEYCKYHEDEWKLLFGQKSLLLDESNQKRGVYSRFMEVTSCSLMRMVHSLVISDNKNFGVNKNGDGQVSYIVKDCFDDFGLSARESEIIFHTIRGKTAKEIARLVDLSYRTVEKHLDRIKKKMDCMSKSQLIEKAIARGIGTYLPISELGL